jgi:alkanesulfonate monooxygenase SsuD/methylene tetrahydromethanopterin reductase-like flavin-dependent oxidoreductase (luciferase family)
MLEEQLQILRGLWEQPDGWSFHGRHYTLDDALFAARPEAVGGRPPVIVGGSGRPRSYRIAARYADEFNLTSSDAAETAGKFRALDDACRAIGRDPATLRRSAMVTALIGRDEATLRRRVDGMLARTNPGVTGAAAWRHFEERRSRWIAGTFDEARAAVQRFADAGVERLMLQDLHPWDVDMVRDLGEALVARG